MCTLSLIQKLFHTASKQRQIGGKIFLLKIVRVNKNTLGIHSEKLA